MSRQVEPGIPAQYQYQSVQYTHIDVDPGSSLVLVADTWSYLKAWLSRNAAKSRGDKRQRFEIASYYADLAMGFYEAANRSQLPTKATLVYYGMLNLAKAYISISRKSLGSQMEHHGLTSGHVPKVITVLSPAKPSSSHINIFQEFSKSLNTPVTTKNDITLAEICSQIPEIHEMAFTLNLLPAGKRNFLPVKIDFRVNDKKNCLFTEIRYEKKSETRIKNLQFLKGHRAAYFKEIPGPDECLVFRSKTRRKVDNRNWKRVYRNILKDYKRLDIWSLLTHKGYIYYCNLSSPPYHQFAYVMMLMFYLGTIARYKPEETKKVLASEMSPLLTEAVKICPLQFLYQLTSRITDNVCVKPHAALE